MTPTLPTTLLQYTIPYLPQAVFSAGVDSGSWRDRGQTNKKGTPRADGGAADPENSDAFVVKQFQTLV